MSGPREDRYDVFLSYNRQDQSVVAELADLLGARGLKVFRDVSDLVPGGSWLEQLEAAISSSRSVAVACGPAGLGYWASREVGAFLQQRRERNLPVIPVLLPGTGAEPELPVFLRELERVDLRSGLLPEGVDRLVWGITQRAPETPARFKLWNVPPLPQEYQARQELEPLRRALVSPAPRSLEQRGQYERFAIQGMGGAGKSVLAAALARDPEVQRAFPGGVFWLTLGQQPGDAVLLQARLAAALNGAHLSLHDVEDGRSALRGLFSARGALLVLDDVWDHRHLHPFGVLDWRSKLLVTTRKTEVADGVRAELHSVSELPQADALELLASYAALRREDLPPEALDLVRECGELPLALAMAGSLLRRRPRDRWPEMLARLRSADLNQLGKALPDYPHNSLRAAIDVSVEDLPPATRARYLDLAVFPEDVPVPEDALCTLWAPDGLDAGAVKDVVDTLVERALARRDEKGGLTLHDLQYDYVRARHGDLRPLHARLIAAYRRRGGGTLHAVPDDGYFYQHVAAHLAVAEGPLALRALLFDPRWLAAKLARTETGALLADFQHLGASRDEPAQQLHDALRLSAHVLDRHPEELVGQIVGRLGDEAATALRILVEDARRNAPRPALVPDWARLAPPGGPLVKSFLGHRAWVTAVAISRDGRYAVSSSHDKTLIRWDLRSGKRVSSLEGHQGWVASVAIDGEGRRAVSGASDATVKLWDLESGTLLRSFEGHDGWVTAVALGPDGRHAVSGSKDKLVKLWDVESGTLLRTFAGHQGWVSAVAVSPDGERILSGSEDETLKLWSLGSGELLRTFEGHEGWVTGVAFSPDRQHALSSSEDKTIRLWSLATGEVVRACTIQRDGVLAVSISPDGQRALAGSYVDTPVETLVSRGGFDLNGLHLWDLATGKLRSFHPSPLVKTVAITPDGRHALSSSDDFTLKLWDLASGELVRSPHEHGDIVKAVAVSPDGTTALSGSYDNTLKLWNLKPGRHLRFFETGRRVHAVAFLPDGVHALVGSSDSTLKLWNVATGELVRCFEGHHKRVRALAVDPGGGFALSGSDDSTLNLWELPSGRLVRTLLEHQLAVTAVAIGADGRSALSGSKDQTVRLWDLGSGRALRTFGGYAGGVTCLALFPDGRRALVGGQTLGTLDLAGGAVSPFPDAGATLAVAISPDGRHALASSAEKTLQLWDLSAARVLASFTAESCFHALAFDGRGNRVVAGDESGRVHLLEVLLC